MFMYCTGTQEWDAARDREWVLCEVVRLFREKGSHLKRMQDRKGSRPIKQQAGLKWKRYARRAHANCRRAQQETTYALTWFKLLPTENNCTAKRRQMVLFTVLNHMEKNHATIPHFSQIQTKASYVCLMRLWWIDLQSLKGPRLCMKYKTCIKVLDYITFTILTF